MAAMAWGKVFCHELLKLLLSIRFDLGKYRHDSVMILMKNRVVTLITACKYCDVRVSA